MDDNLLFNEARPIRADALQNRAHLLETARRLFNEQGVEGVTMSAVAQAAGVGKGTLYRHFENKTELCFALLDEDQRTLQERSFQRFRTTREPLENLRWFLIEVAEFVERNRAFLCAGDTMQEKPTAALAHPAHQWWRQTIYHLLSQLRPAGDVSYMADVLFVMLDVHTIYFQRNILGYTRERLHDGLISTLLKLIA